MRLLFIGLILYSQICLSENDDSANIRKILDQCSDKATINDPIEIKPLYIPDEKLQNKSNTNSAQSNNTTNQTDNKKSTGSLLIKPAEWMLESALDNAPALLKGIFTYLQSHVNKRSLHYNTIPSFHRFILAGPPGTGKTTLAHAIAHKLGCSIVFVAATSLLGRYRNETSTNITHFLKEQAGVERSIVIIIDELHKLFEHYNNEHSDDSQTAAAFWLMLDRLEKYYPNVIVIGTANSVNKLPPEIKSRFSGKIINLPLPDLQQKVLAFKNNIFNDQLITLDNSIDDSFIEEMLGKISNGSLRDIQLIIDTAKMFYYAEQTLYEYKFPIVLTKKHFQQALKQLKDESVILQETVSDIFNKRLRDWGVILSIAVNVTTLIQSWPFLKKIFIRA